MPKVRVTNHSSHPGPRLLVVAGEASADAHAASVLKALKGICPQVQAFGVGGKRLREVGMDTLVDSQTLSVVGGTDWLDRFGEVFGGYRRIRNVIRTQPPDAALLLDLPDFNLLLARQLKKRGVPIIYFISPQVWAWRQYRVKTIQRVVSKMLVVFPFEQEFYRSRGVDAEFVGHPLVESFEARKEFRPQAEVLKAPRIALLPGSRPSELKFHGELLGRVRQELKTLFPAAEFRVPIASTLSADKVDALLGLGAGEAVENQTRAVFEWADFALVASGTATLEAALVNVPFALFYRVSPLSWWAVKNIVGYGDFLGMPNLLSGREVVREFLQEGATVENLVTEAKRLVQDESYRRQMIEGLGECREKLGAGGASLRVAEEVDRVLRTVPPLGVPGLQPAPAT